MATRKKKKGVPLLSWLGIGNGNGVKAVRRRNGNGKKRTPVTPAVTTLYEAKFLSNGGAKKAFKASAERLRYAVIASSTRKGPRTARQWFSTKAAAERVMAANKGKGQWYQISRVKARVSTNGNGNGNGAKKKPAAKKPVDRGGYAARRKAVAKAIVRAKPAPKRAPKLKFKDLPVPTSTDLVNYLGEKIPLASLGEITRVLARVKVGDELKVVANNIPRGPMRVVKLDRSTDLWTIDVKGKRGSIYPINARAPVLDPDTGKLKKTRYVQAWAYAARGSSTVRALSIHDPALEEAKRYKGPRPGSKDWKKTSDTQRLDYFRFALWELANKTGDTSDLRMKLILQVERPLEKDYVCRALKAYGPVPKVPKVDIGAIFVSSWGYDQTNVDFYEVVRKTASSVELRKIGKRTQSAVRGSDRVVPTKGAFVAGSKPKLKRLQYSWGVEKALRPYVTISSFQHASLWDGKPRHETAAGYGH